MEFKIHNQKGQEVGKADLPAEIFELKINSDLIHQVVMAQMANARNVIAHTKDRSEVSGGGVKPWRQKGTGRARHGSIRSPLWRGGGITFGPTKERNFKKKINKKMKRQALFMALSSKVKDNQMILLDKLELTEAKTSQMSAILNYLKLVFGNDFRKGTLIVLPEIDEKIIRASRNIPKIKTIGAKNLNTLDVLNYQQLILLNDSVGLIKKTYLK